MTKQERQQKIRELSKQLWLCDDSNEYDKLYDEYVNLVSIDNEEYRKEYEPHLKQFFEENIKGKTWEQINPDDWSFYSDFHKDVYGYRPRSISCGGC